MQAHDFEPMSIGRILDRTFRIYKENFIRFITIVAIIQVPIALLMAVSMSALQRGVPVRQPTDYEPLRQEAEQNGEDVTVGGRQTRSTHLGQDEYDPAVAILGGLGMMLSGIIAMFGQVLCRGALTKSVSESYLGNEITVGQAYKFVLPKFLTLIGAGILVVLVVYLGLLLLVVPGIIFGLWFALTTPAIVVENLKATKGMSRSKALASGNLGKIFSVAFLIIILAWVIAIPFSYVGGFLGSILFPGSVMLMTFVNQLFSVVGQILIVPIGATAYILLYYDLRIRKEGFDLQMLANSISSGQSVANVNQSPQ
jgi:hypothetical protein